MPIITNIVSSNRVHGEVYSIQHYAIKFVNDLHQVGGFLRKKNWLPRYNWIGAVMVSVITQIAVDRGQTEDNTNSICCFSTKHAA